MAGEGLVLLAGYNLAVVIPPVAQGHPCSSARVTFDDFALPLRPMRPLTLEQVYQRLRLCGGTFYQLNYLFWGSAEIGALEIERETENHQGSSDLLPSVSVFLGAFCGETKWALNALGYQEIS